MSSVASKNLFELLGNDPDEEPKAPVEPVDKPAQRHGKRNEAISETPKEAVPSAQRGGGRGGRGRGRGEYVGNERAFQDREVGRSSNRGKPIDDGLRADRHSDRLGGGRIQRGGSYDGRGGRGGAGGRGGRGGKDDRHSRSLKSDSQKQADQGWGGETGTAEWNDEKAGQAQAVEEEKSGFDAFPDKPVNAEGAAPAENGEAAEPHAETEPEDKSMSYTDYLAKLAEKKLALGGNLDVRKANEGASKKQPDGKALEQAEETDFFVGGGGKKQRDRERKEKNTLLLDHDYAPREQPAAGRGGRGGRGRGRGDRGDFRGDRRGGPRGGGNSEGRGGRGGVSRGGRGGSTPNVTDSSAFPTLGS